MPVSFGTGCSPPREDEWGAVIRVHLKGHFCTTRHLVNYWRDEAKAGAWFQDELSTLLREPGSWVRSGKAPIRPPRPGSPPSLSYGPRNLVVMASSRDRTGSPHPNDRSCLRRLHGRPRSGSVRCDGTRECFPLGGVAGVRRFCGRHRSSVRVEGGIISVADGWQHEPRIDKGAVGTRAMLVAPFVTSSPAHLGLRRCTEPHRRISRRRADRVTNPELQALNNHRHTLAATDAHGLKPVATTAVVQRVEQCRHDACTGHSEGVPEGDCSTVHVQLFVQRYRGASPKG